MPLASTPLRSLLASIGLLPLALALPSVAFATPQITNVSSAAVTDGDMLILDGSGFLPDPARYAVVLRDTKGLVALGEVVSATHQTLHVEIYGLGRESTAADVVLHEGVSFPLVGVGLAEAKVENATWFHGSGVTTITGPVAVLSPLATTPTAPTGRTLTKPTINLPTDCGGGFSIDIPLGCNEITARIRVGGDDPFDNPPLWWPTDRQPTKAKGSIFDLWSGIFTVRLSSQVVGSSQQAAQAIAHALSDQFRTFGVEAKAEDDDQGDTRVVLYGERITPTTGAAVVTLVCEPE
ncbi:MAG: hypothetical protein AAGE94_07255 [Acidobacteriota bacterium]